LQEYLHEFPLVHIRSLDRPEVAGRPDRGRSLLSLDFVEPAIEHHPVDQLVCIPLDVKRIGTLDDVAATTNLPGHQPWLAAPAVGGAEDSSS
jgi:hypothetical protein